MLQLVRNYVSNIDLTPSPITIFSKLERLSFPLILKVSIKFIAGSFSRSAVNYMAGCQTAVSNIIMSFVVFLTLEFITPLFKYTPNAILSSIIISAVIGLIDYDAAILIWKIDKLDFVACLGAFLGVIFASVEIGLLIAVRNRSSVSFYLLYCGQSVL